MLLFLDFDTSEDAAGNCTFDAMASVAVERLPALEAELAAVVAWATRHTGEEPGPLDEGHAWDCDLTASRETSQAQQARLDPATGRLALQPAGDVLARITLTLAISADAAFAAAFRTHFQLD
ncbi:MAG TPA: hypothetical protein VGE70_03495 [Burkholderiaceae bacterium]